MPFNPWQNNIFLTPFSPQGVGAGEHNLLCKSWHLIQYLANKCFIHRPHHPHSMRGGGVAIKFVQIWIFHSISSKKKQYFCKLMCHPWGVGIGEHEFYAQIWISHSIPNTYNLRRQLTPIQQQLKGRWQKQDCLCRSGHHIQFLANDQPHFVLNWSPLPHMRGGVSKMSFMCRFGHFI